MTGLPIHVSKEGSGAKPPNNIRLFLSTRKVKRPLPGSNMASALLLVLTLEFPVRLQQIEDVGANLGRFIVPFVDPMAVDFPIRTGLGITVIRAPLADRLMRLAEPTIVAKVNRR